MLAVIKLKINDRLQTSLGLRYILTDTLVSKGIGVVVNEGSDNVEMSIEMEFNDRQKFDKEVNSILQSLGLNESSRIFYNP